MLLGEKSELSQFLKKLRGHIDPVASRFFDQNRTKLGVSYSVFVHYENGTRLPSIEYLLRVAPLLSAKVSDLCHLWARAQMPTEETKTYFNLPDGTIRSQQPRVTHNDIYRFSRSDINILKQEPRLFLIANFLAAFSDDKPISVSEVARLAGVAKPIAITALKKLTDLGVVFALKGNMYKSKYKDFEIPRDDDAFREVRDNNFKLIGGIVLKNFTTKKRNLGEAQRFTFTLRMTPEIQRLIQAKLSEIERFFDTLPTSHGVRLGSVCISFSDYFER